MIVSIFGESFRALMRPFCVFFKKCLRAPAFGVICLDMAKTTTKIDATRAGITNETFGEWNGLSRRYMALGNTVEALNCARRCLDIAETWGHLFPVNANVLAVVRQRIAYLAGK